MFSDLDKTALVLKYGNEILPVLPVLVKYYKMMQDEQTSISDILFFTNTALARQARFKMYYTIHRQFALYDRQQKILIPVNTIMSG